MIVPVRCNVKCVDLSTLPNGILMAGILLNLCGAYTDAGQKILTNLFLALENSFSMDMKFKRLFRNEGGNMSLSPHAAPALSDDDVAPVRELSHRESHSDGGEAPSERLAGN
jgi:hypothetical protein